MGLWKMYFSSHLRIPIRSRLLGFDAQFAAPRFRIFGQDAISFASCGSKANSSIACLACGVRERRIPANSSKRLLPCDGSFASAINSSIVWFVTVAASALARPSFGPMLLPEPSGGHFRNSDTRSGQTERAAGEASAFAMLQRTSVLCGLFSCSSKMGTASGTFFAALIELTSMFSLRRASITGAQELDTRPRAWLLLRQLLFGVSRSQGPLPNEQTTPLP